MSCHLPLYTLFADSYRDIVSGMDIAEMEESFHGECEEDYHPFKNGNIELE